MIIKLDLEARGELIRLPGFGKPMMKITKDQLATGTTFKRKSSGL